LAQTLSDIKSLLSAHGLRPSHRFGQNFLHDANQMRRIMEAAQIVPGELVLEVGPGTGALSEWLLDAGAELVVVEIDHGLEPILRARLTPGERRPSGGCAALVMGDVLAKKHALNPDVITAISSPAPRPFKLVANLPYNVASPLLANLAADHPLMTMAVVMIQREVADRLAAGPNGIGTASGGGDSDGKDYGPLGILIQAVFEVDRVAVLSPGCFWPAPKVDSAVVRLRRRATPLTDDLPALSALLHELFSKRRKQLGAILGRGRAMPEGIDMNARPEELSISQLITLSKWRKNAETPPGRLS